MGDGGDPLNELSNLSCLLVIAQNRVWRKLGLARLIERRRFFAHRPLFERPVQHGGQLGEVDGLCQVLVCSGLERVDRGLHFSVGSQHEDGQVFVGPAKTASNFDAVDVWHLEIGDDGVRRLLVVSVEQLVGPLEDFRTEGGGTAKIGGQQLRERQIIIQDVDFGWHACNLCENGLSVQPRSQEMPPRVGCESLNDQTDFDEAIAQIRLEFGGSLPARLDAMRTALEKLSAGFEQASAETFFLQAHSLKGTAGAFEASELEQHAMVLADIGKGWRSGESISADGIESAGKELKLLAQAVERYLQSAKRR